jgi:hypothetical protein
MPATITTATQRKALEQRQAATRKALADRRKFLHRMRNRVHQYTGIDMRDQELVRLERENRDVKQALDALYRQEGQASAATKSKVVTKRRKRTRGRRRGRSSGSKKTSSRKQLVLGLVLAVAGALAVGGVVNREKIRKQWREWLKETDLQSQTSKRQLLSHTPRNTKILEYVSRKNISAKRQAFDKWTATRDRRPRTRRNKIHAANDAKEKLAAVKSALSNLRQKNNPKQLQNACPTLQTYTTNLLNRAKDTPHRRTISTTNSRFKKHIAPLEGHLEFFKACGMTESGTYLEWQWHTAEKDSEEEKANNEALEVVVAGLEAIKKDDLFPWE